MNKSSFSDPAAIVTIVLYTSTYSITGSVFVCTKVSAFILRTVRTVLRTLLC